ncbi:hypothetical protein DFH09DRAFT_1336995 [Mycena vulgaris]|nr:hypothetical protein DFH09DRAFT_1336995 [Mycena vulgaris]
MKSSSTFAGIISALLLALLGASPSVSQNMTVKPPSPLTCGNTSDAVPLYLAEWPGAAFYSTSVSEISTVVSRNTFMFEGISARIFLTQELSTVPLFRLVQGTDMFFTISTTERALVLQTGYIDEGTAGFIYPSQICGSTPFYRIYTSLANEHYYTISSADRDAVLASSGNVPAGG